MAGAYTTLKITPGTHQTLETLLKYLAGKISEAQFRAVMNSQGRNIPDDIPADKLVSVIADQLIGPVS